VSNGTVTGHVTRSKKHCENLRLMETMCLKQIGKINDIAPNNGNKISERQAPDGSECW
jgi:hypothetical protein